MDGLARLGSCCQASTGEKSTFRTTWGRFLASGPLDGSVSDLHSRRSEATGIIVRIGRYVTARRTPGERDGGGRGNGRRSTSDEYREVLKRPRFRSSFPAHHRAVSFSAEGIRYHHRRDVLERRGRHNRRFHRPIVAPRRFEGPRRSCCRSRPAGTPGSGFSYRDHGAIPTVHGNCPSGRVVQSNHDPLPRTRRLRRRPGTCSGHRFRRKLSRSPVRTLPNA